MTTIGQIERKTQQRVVTLFRDTLKYDWLGNWEDRENNRNIEHKLLRTFLKEKQGHDEALIDKALYQLDKTAGDTSKGLYDRNRAVYDLLRYGVKVKADVGENTQTVFVIDWQNVENNHFAIAEEVTVVPADGAAHAKRPDIVLYVNGIALAVLELKRSTVSVAEGIRQNLANQDKKFIEHFFATIQLVMAGNDTEGLRYGTIQTPEKHYLKWKEDSAIENPLDRALVQLCGKPRLLEVIHDFVVFDAGTKKLCRHNQYFGVRAAQQHVQRREGGIIWHTQGSGKSLLMVWLTKWIREHVKDARVLIITDRSELDKQIEAVFKGVNEHIYRTKSGADLLATLNATMPWLLCSLIHKFGGEDEPDVAGYVAELKKALPAGFKAKGDLFVYVDECHRTQSGALHEAMKQILPEALFIGFTGTPLLKADKQKSIEVFGGYIHTYKYDEAVQDGVVLDLRYEARKIDQSISAQERIDQWFDSKTCGLTALAKAQLKQRWGTMQKVLSCKERLERIVADILLDMATRDRLKSGHGNALLVAGSIYEACKYYELFDKSELKGKCAIITSYTPSIADIKGETSGEGETEKLHQYEIYRRMLADWFNEPADKAVNRADEFEDAVKKKFVKEPGQMKLLIVVNMMLTGFDAPPATYLYIDREMRDHGLFQAICRVNRLDGEDKDYGYIIDYKDLFKSLQGAVADYTSAAFDGYAKEEVAGLLKDRLKAARERLREALEQVRALCEPVEPPKHQMAYLRYFSSKESGNAEQLKENEPQRLSLYTLTAALVRAYANIANEMAQAGYSPAETEAIKQEVVFYENLRNEVKLHSGDAIDLKQHEPAMRHLIDTYIRAEPSEKLSAFDDLSLIELIVDRGVDAVQALPDKIKASKEATAEAIENNVRKLIIDEQPINPKYYEKMSALLDALIAQRRKEMLEYAEYLRQIVALTKKVKNPETGGTYPERMNTPGKRALYDNLGGDENLASAVHQAVHDSRQDDWRNHRVKVVKVRHAIKAALLAQEGERTATYPQGAGEDFDAKVERIIELVGNQSEY